MTDRIRSGFSKSAMEHRALLFQDARFFLAAVSERELAGITSLISSQGGKILNFISDSPTFVITEVDDPKAPEVSEAIDVFCVPVVHILWVKLCCAWNRFIPPRYFELNRPYIFRNVRAVVSDSLSEDKSAIWACLTYNGGRLVFHNGIATCTHAIVGDTTQITALNIDVSRIHVVTPDWLVDSVKAGMRKTEFDYHPANLITAAAGEVVPVLLPSAVQQHSSNGMFSSAENSLPEQILPETKDISTTAAGGNLFRQQALVKPDTKSALAKLLNDRQLHQQSGSSELFPASVGNDINPLQTEFLPMQLQPGANVANNNTFSMPTTDNAGSNTAVFSGLRVAAPVLHASSQLQAGLLRLVAPSIPIPVAGKLQQPTISTTISSTTTIQPPTLIFPAPPPALNPSLIPTDDQSVTQVHHPLLNQMLSGASSNSSLTVKIEHDEQHSVLVHSGGGLIAANNLNKSTAIVTAAADPVTTTTTTTTNSSGRVRKSRKREASSRPRMQSGVAASTAASSAAISTGLPTNNNNNNNKRIRGESPLPTYCTTICTDADIELPKNLFFSGCLFYLAQADLKRAYRGQNAVFISATEQLIVSRGGKILAAGDNGRLPKSAFIVSIQLQPEYITKRMRQPQNDSENSADSKTPLLLDETTDTAENDADEFLLCSYRHVTPDWLWTCESQGRLVPPENLLHLPVVNATVLSNWRVCFANFNTIESRLLSQNTAALGAYTCEYLTRDCNILICKSLLGHKFTAAYEWSIPTVNCTWLADIMLGTIIQEQELSASLQQQKRTNFFHPRYQEFAGPKTEDALRALKVVEHRQLAEKGRLMHAWLEPIRVTADQIRDAHERQSKHVENQSITSPPANKPDRRFSVDLYEERVRKLRSDLLESTILEADAAVGSSSNNMIHNSNSNASSTLNTTDSIDNGPVLPSLPAAVTLTGFTVGETFDLRERLLRLGARFVDEVSTARVLIADAPTRTLKFLAAINCCPHIVNSRWLDACEHAGKLLMDDGSLTAHSLSGEARNSEEEQRKKSGFVDLGRSLRERGKTGLGKLFSKMAFHIAPAVEFGRGSLEYLIETGGGSIEQPFKAWNTIRDGQRADANCRIIAIGHPNFPDEYRYLINHGIAVYSAEFILDAVANQVLDYSRNRIDKPCRMPESSNR